MNDRNEFRGSSTGFYILSSTLNSYINPPPIRRALFLAVTPLPPWGMANTKRKHESIGARDLVLRGSLNTITGRSGRPIEWLER